MAKTQGNIVKVIVDSLSIMDTGSSDGMTTIATATAGGEELTVTVTGINVTENSLAIADAVIIA